MVFKLFSFLIIILTTLLSNSASAHSHDHQITNHSSPFEFIKHLQGCRKGEKFKGLHELKNYLEKFGYLNSNIDLKHNQTHLDDDDFDDLLESAIKTYQQNYHIAPTGVLDGETVSKMTAPRCGVADIINGTNRMSSSQKRNRHNRSTHFHTVSHYTFFQGFPRWSASKFHLTYGFLPGTRTDAMDPVARAFNTWAANTHFTFSRTEDYQNADITIGFLRGDHGDGSPFDGLGGTLAHAFQPEIGRFHYDADEPWGVGAKDVIDLETVALHEIGHLLGLGHSNVEGAIMWPTFRSGMTQQRLHEDDIQGIRALYSAQV